MPRKKSVVHHHFKKADNQGSRKIEVVECIHCGHQVAGNNVTRLLKHLQNGCWPASSTEDPALLLANRPASHAVIAGASTGLRSRTSQMDHTDNDSIAVANPSRPRRSAPARSTVTTNQEPGVLAPTSNVVQSTETQPCLLLNITVKETKDPAVSRLMAVPRNFTFRHLQRAVSVAFAYRSDNGMFEVTYPNWLPGRGRPPRRKQICVFHNAQQKENWHAWDQSDEADEMPDERYLDELSLDGLLAEVKSCKMVFHVGPWAHDIEVLGPSELFTVHMSVPGNAVCLAGEGHPVLESSDPMMWQAFKDSYATNSPNSTQKSYRVFYQTECQYGDPRGLGGGMPWIWDREHVNRELKILPGASIIPTANMARGPVIGGVHGGVEDHNMTADENNAVNRLADQTHIRNPGFQGGQMMYDHQTRGLHHPMQHDHVPWQMTLPH